MRFLFFFFKRREPGGQLIVLADFSIVLCCSETLLSVVGTAEKCHERTHALQRMTCLNCNDLLNHCDGEQLSTRPVYTLI
jgi:hypothetical protein